MARKRKRQLSLDVPQPDDVRQFFAWCNWLDYEVLRPLSHAKSNWELQWDHGAKGYEVEDESFAESLNALIDELALTAPPERYHDNEDALAEYLQRDVGWPLTKVEGRWEGAPYAVILEQGGFGDLDQRNLTEAATGRVHLAIRLGQANFDEMEADHQRVLAWALTAVLYHRCMD